MRARRAALHARARLLVARLQPRAAPLRRPRAPRPLGAALAGLRELVEGVDDPGMLYAYSVPWLGRLLARRGDRRPARCSPPRGSTRAASGCCSGVAYAGLAYVEWAWLAGGPEVARRGRRGARAAAAHPGGAPFRAELLRYLARAGMPAEPLRLPGAVGGRPPRRLARGGGGVGRRRRPLRAGARAGRVRRAGADARGPADPRRARRHRPGGARPRAPPRSAPPYRGARARRRAPTPPGSPSASWRCWRW